MKKTPTILFVIRSVGQMHHYKSIAYALARRGYKLQLLFDKRWSKGDTLEPVETLIKQFPNVSWKWAISRTDWWRKVLFYFREIRSFRRYLIVTREKQQSTFYRDRYEGYLPKSFQRILKIPFMRNIVASRFFGDVLMFVEWLVPSYRPIVEHVQRFKPDIVIAGPTNLRFSSADLEYLKAASRLHIKTAVPVVSWDNLTTKGFLHIWPDVLLSWNEVQREEARVHQFFPPSRVRIIGAPIFDWTFDAKLSRSREDFCCEFGLNSEYPILLYLGSSSNMAEDETWLVCTLRETLNKADDARVKNVQIVVRPHPANYGIYEKLQMPGIFVVPKKGSLPDVPEASKLFFDSVYHAIAVVIGANTTAVIDSTVLGKPAVAYLNDKYRKTQAETTHFQQLLDANIFELVKTPQEFLKSISLFIDGKDPHEKERQAYLKRYIRPYGMETPAGEIAAREVDRMLENGNMV